MFTHIQALKKKEKKKPESFQTEESPRTQSANKQPSPKPTFFSEETYRWAFAALFFFVLSPPCGSSPVSL